MGEFERQEASLEYQQLDVKHQRECVLDWIRSDPSKMTKELQSFSFYLKSMRGYRQIVETEFANGRALQSSGLDSTGFALHTHHSSVSDWNDDAEVQRTYYSEIALYVQKLTGADFVFCNDHSIRQTEDTSAAGQKDEESKKDPLGMSMKNPLPVVHNDFTCSYSESLARALELDDPSEARMATFGLLGQLKAAGVTGADLRTKYPAMTNEEVLLFKTYDSADPSSRGQLHAAFQPHGPKPVHGRFSCEARVLCLVSRG